MPTQKVLAIGSGDALVEVASVDTSAGAADAGKLVALDSAGKLPNNMMPNGMATPDTQTALTSEALAANDWVNIYDNAGVLTVRKAIGTDGTKPCHGFVKQAYANGVSATVYVQGVNSSIPIANVAGAAVAKRGKKAFLSASAAGQATCTQPSGSGNLAQALGDIVECTATLVNINFIPETGIIRA